MQFPGIVGQWSRYSKVGVISRRAMVTLVSGKPSLGHAMEPDHSQRVSNPYSFLENTTM